MGIMVVKKAVAIYLRYLIAFALGGLKRRHPAVHGMVAIK